MDAFCNLGEEALAHAPSFAGRNVASFANRNTDRLTLCAGPQIALHRESFLAAANYESEGRAFESLRAHQNLPDFSRFLTLGRAELSLKRL